MSARQKFGLTLAGVLVVFGFPAYAVFAAGGKPDFSIAVSPAARPSPRGRRRNYSITVTRANGFTGAVSLSAGSLPSSATASWKLQRRHYFERGSREPQQRDADDPDGGDHPQRHLPAADHGDERKSRATLQTSRRLSKTAAQPNFSVTTNPASQTVLQGDVRRHTA